MAGLPKGLPKSQDAYGRAMFDHFEGRGEDPIIERDDGMITADIGVSYWFAPLAEWAPWEIQGLEAAHGRVLDVGAGAGRAALALQERGQDVVAIDNSPLAVQLCKRRGVKDARVMPFTAVSRKLGEFDSLVAFGNNFGLFGGFERAQWLLRRLKGMTSNGARIVASTLDPYVTALPEHRSYHRLNRSRGRMGGQLRLRVRYLTMATPWFDYLIASPDEINKIAKGTGWHVAGMISIDLPDIRPYVVVLERE